MVNRRALGVAAALFYIALWASAFVPSKIAVLDSSPLWLLVARFSAAGVLSLVIALAVRARFPRTPSAWAGAVAFGLLANAGYLGLTYEALRHLASGVGSIVASTNPLVLALVAPWVLREPLTPRKLAGLLLGFGGVVAIAIVRTGTGGAEPRDIALASAGVLASVASTIVFKRWCADDDLRAINAVQLVAAALVLVPLAALLEGAPHATMGPRLIVSFWYVVLVMSIGASYLWFRLLRTGDASRVSAYYFLTPVFGLAFAALLMHEPVGVRDLGGLAAIAAGIALVQRG